MRWLFPGTEIRLDTRCLDCGEAILVRMRDEEILEVDPRIGDRSQLGRDLIKVGHLPDFVK